MQVINFSRTGRKVNNCLDSMKEIDLECVVVIGLDKEGACYSAMYVPAGLERYKVLGAIEMMKVLYLNEGEQNGQ